MNRITKFLVAFIMTSIITFSIEGAHRVQRTMGHLVTVPTPVQLSVTPGDVRATREHLSHTELNDEAKKMWRPFIAKQRYLIETIVQREEDYERDYYVVYHAHNNIIRLVQDFLYLLYQWEFKAKLSNDFMFFRYLVDAVQLDAV